MNTQAKQLGLETIQVKELLRQMGSPLPPKAVRYGIAANPADFQPQPPEGGPKVSQGSVTISTSIASRRPGPRHGVLSFRGRHAFGVPHPGHGAPG